MAERPRGLPPRWGRALRQGGVRPDDSGAAAVEFALVLIPLVLLVFGIINFGFMFAGQISMNAAARDAARAGIVTTASGGMTCAEIVQRAQQQLSTFTSNPTAVVTSVVKADGTTLCSGTGPASAPPTGQTAVRPCAGTVENTPLKVRIAFAYTNPVPIVPPYRVDLTADGVFRCEYA